MDQIHNIAKNKIIILYYMQALDIPLTNPQITQFFLENNIIPYFELQQYLSELIDTKLVNFLEARDKYLYSISPTGTKVLELFEHRISSDLKQKIDNYAHKNRNRLRKESQITAEYKKLADRQYIITCRVMEEDMILLELKLNVTDSKQAKLICNNWLNRAPVVYKNIIATLTT
ncbi:MAG TPA: DUF4364 family protein [Clostridiales bacterium]|nr:DUF4364 family protein [Clostridiales bacterium]